MSETKLRIGKQLQLSSSPASILYTNADNELTYLAPPGGADVIPFYDDSGVVINWLTLGTNLSISGTTLNATAGAGGYSEIQEEGSPVGASNTKINFVGAGLTAADAGSGVTSVTVDATLNALAGYNTNGLLTQTAADTFTGRTITGTADRITITDGNGVSGNPTINIASTYVGQNSITTLGTITTGIWNGTAVADEYGGTGQTTYAQGDILYASAANTLSKLTVGGANTVLQSNGTVPSWQTLDSSDLSDGANIAHINANETISGTWTFSNNITLNGTPSASTDVITVGYLQTQLANQRRTSVRVATTTAGTLATSFENGDTIDDITLSTGDRILIKDQAAPAQNGIYIVQASGAPVRADDMNAASEVDGTMVIVEDGTTNAGTIWYTISEVTTLDTDSIVWTRLDKATDITAGSGLSFSGLTLNVGTASTGRIVVNANDIDLASGIVAGGGGPGSYGSATQVGTFTVDTYGRLTSASNTTIAIPSTAITDFTEAVQDVVGNASFLSGTGSVTVTYNDGANTLVIDGTNTNIYNTNGTIPAATNRVVSFGNSATTLEFQNAATGVLLSLSDDSVYFNDGVAQFDTDEVNFTTTGGSYDISSAGHVWVIASGADTSITDSRATPLGLEYAADYSATFTTNSLITKKYVDDQISASTTTITRYYVEGSTASTIDLDSGTAVKDIDGNNDSATIPTNHDNLRIYRNGVLLSETGDLTTRDYSLNDSTHVITLATALSASEILIIEITQ